jgi:hypothetical protein
MDKFRRIFSFLTVLLISGAAAFAAQRMPLLAAEQIRQQLPRVLVRLDDYHPFPTWHEQPAWQALSDSVRHFYIKQAEELLNYQWPALPATLYLEFKRDGNRNHYEEPHFDRRTRLGQLIIGECMEGRGRFLDDIANGIWVICEESFWGLPAHMSAQKAGVGLPDVAEPIVDLFAAETAGLMAWAHYLLGSELDKVSPLLRSRMKLEIERRLLQPCREREFDWMGFPDRTPNNWNPWINSNWLTCVLLMEKDPERRVQDVTKILRSLDRFLAGYGDDGGCDEGPGYWGRAGASLFDNLELLYGASHGALNFYHVPLVQEIGRYLYRVHIADRYFVNFADGPGILSPSSELVYRFGKRIDDPLMMNLGLFLPRTMGIGRIGSLGRELPGLFEAPPGPNPACRAPLVRDHFFKDIQVMIARSIAGSSRGLYVAAKGGHNDESHNHNDVGHYIIYQEGQPMIVDAGVGTYTAKTFSAKRYEIWTMQSAYHSLPTIDGVMQKNGREFQATDVRYTCTDKMAKLQLDMAAAYPAEAGLKSWLRSIELLRGQEVRIQEHYDLTTPAQEITLSLLTPCTIVVDRPGQARLTSTMAGQQKPAELTLVYDASVFQIKTEAIPLDDERLKSTWGGQLMRILLIAAKPPQRAEWVVRFKM